MKKLLLVLLLMGLISIGVIVLDYPDTNLRVIACDVGQGDSILIQQAFFQVIVDGGPGNRLLSCLGRHMPFWDRTVEVVILTHPQADHYEGLIPLFNRYRVEHFVGSVFPGEGESFTDLVTSISEEDNLIVTLPEAGQKITRGDLELKILWPQAKIGTAQEWLEKKAEFQASIEVDDPNQISTVGLLKYKNFSVLLTGDIGIPEESALITNGVLTDIDVLKIAHHGSKHSSSMGFLRTTDPEVVLVSVGQKNSYGHPAKEMLQRIEEIGATVYRTDEVGDIVVVSNGHVYWVEK